jgi:hypothetical protein
MYISRYNSDSFSLATGLDPTEISANNMAILSKSYRP